jgi:hypothetical protein
MAGFVLTFPHVNTRMLTGCWQTYSMIIGIRTRA